ncbi:MAG: nucleotide exchange factor GrpE [Thermoplasmata archaeon]
MSDPKAKSPTPKASTDPPEETPSEQASETPGEEDWASRFKYLLADFENYRRRAARDVEAASARARGQLLREVLPVYEAVEHAREHTTGVPPSDPVRKGLDLIAREFEAFLEREGVVPVARPGDAFDPQVEEAVGEVPASKDRSAGTVAEVVQQGYRSAQGLLRLAKVIVARDLRPTEAPDAEGIHVPVDSPSDRAES